MIQKRHWITVFIMALLLITNVFQYNIQHSETDIYKKQILDLTKRLDEYKEKENIQVNYEEPSVIDIGETVDRIKKDLNLMSTKLEVETLLGTDCVQVEKAEGKLDFLWRYDLLKNENYFFNDKMDTVDIDGILTGDVGVVVFVDFDEDEKLIAYSLYYSNDVRDSVYEFRVTQASSVETKIR